MRPFDPRLTPRRPDLAAAHLEGQVEAPRFAEGQTMQVVAASTPLRREPRFDAPLDTEALHGEEIVVYDTSGEGWAWGQLAGDGYVGYVPADDLVPRNGPAADFKVAALRTFLYPGPSIKLPPLCAWPFNATTAVQRSEGDFAVTPGGFIFADHLVPVGARSADPTHLAERFLEAPYLWGGKTSLGLDCSALVQLALQSAGVACPRDTDMQEVMVGETLAVDGAGGLERGDLVFWKGHVGIMRDGERLIHANAHHMRVAEEPLAGAIARIAAKGGGGVTSIKRIRPSDRAAP